MTDSPALRKARGAFFTPPAMSRFLAGWAIRTPDDQVLEPSAGEASLLLAAGERLRDLRAGAPLDLWGPRGVPAAQLHGVELHAASAAAARDLLVGQGFAAKVRAADFFDVPPAPHYDAVVGNPPYIRYQDFAGEARAKGLRAAFAQGVRLTGLASAWAPFTVHAAQFLRRGGRLGLVLPAELLSVNYAAEVRRFLLERFASVRLVLFEERVFPGVLEEVVLLLAEGHGPAPSFEVFQARDLRDLPDLLRALYGSEAGTGSDAGASSDGAPAGADAAAGVRGGWTGFVPFTPARDGKWLPALVDADAIATYHALLDGPHFVPMLGWGSTYLGAVTGNNAYFALTAERAREAGLTDRELRRVSPPGSRHLTGLTFTTQAWQNLVRHGEAGFLFYPDPQDPSPQAATYIRAGQAAGVHEAYKCRARKPWWRVPVVAVPDLLLTYMVHDRVRLTSNAAGVLHLNSLYGVALEPAYRSLGRALLPVASVNSVTLLGGETVGRAYGGGLLKLEPKEADRLPLPSPALLAAHADALRAVRPQVAALLRARKLDEAVRQVDRILLTPAAGVSAGDLRALRAAREVLFSRRVTRGRGKAPTPGGREDARGAH